MRSVSPPICEKDYQFINKAFQCSLVDLFGNDRDSMTSPKKKDDQKKKEDFKKPELHQKIDESIKRESIEQMES